MTPQFLELPDERKDAFIADVVGQLSDYMDDDGLAAPQEVRFLTANKPA